MFHEWRGPYVAQTPSCAFHACPIFEPPTNSDFFAQVRVDDELGTVVWPNGADLDPLVLHGDFEPVSRFAHR
jgi:Protein of unknown function (DUF2442)